MKKLDAAKLAIYSDSVQGEVLADINIAALDAGEKRRFKLRHCRKAAWDLIRFSPIYIIWQQKQMRMRPIIAITKKDVYVHAKCAISLSSGNGGTVRGTGSYSYGSTVTISAIPNEGYMFEGWYENGRCLDNISDEYTFTAFANRTIEAKFVPNDLTISNVEVIGDKEPEETLIFLRQGGRRMSTVCMGVYYLQR